MDFIEAEQYIADLDKFGIQLGLERMNELLCQLGSPEKNLKFIHVGGTNGKGSTSSMVANILREAGYKVGYYTSPHIHTYRERITIDGEMISKSIFGEMVRDISEMASESMAHMPTEFEFLTALAFAYFYKRGVDIAVVEVGMGGRLDATNIIPFSEVSVITNISKDHMEHLGSNIRDIAVEKAGIIKRKSMLITAETNKEILSVFTEKCIENKSEILTAAENINIVQGPISVTQDGFVQKCSIIGNHFKFDDLQLSMPGKHQTINAATALLVAEALYNKGYTITAQHVKAGLEKTNIFGRIQILNKKPLIILDVAHNCGSVQALKQVLKEINHSYDRLVLVTAILDDKERDKISAIWGDLPSSVVITKPDNKRSKDWKDVAKLFKRFVRDVYLEERIEDAITLGKNLIDGRGCLCIAGTFYIMKRAEEQIFMLFPHRCIQKKPQGA